MKFNRVRTLLIDTMISNSHNQTNQLIIVEILYNALYITVDTTYPKPQLSPGLLISLSIGHNV